MTSADTYFKFVIYEGDPTQAISFLDLTGLGKLYLNFYTNNGSVNKFLNYMSPEISMASGEVLFKVPSKDCQRISQYNDTTFTVSSVNDENETQLYTGSFVKVGNTVTSFMDRKIENQQESISEYAEQVTNLEQYNSIIVEENNRYSSLNTVQNVLIQDLQAILGQTVKEANSILEIDAVSQEVKLQMISKIAEAQILIARVAAIADVQVVDGSTPSQSVDPTADQANIADSANSPFTS